MKPSHGPHPPSGRNDSQTSVFGLLTTTVADVGPPPRRRRRAPTTATASRCRPRPCATRRPSRPSTSPACGPGGPRTWASPPWTPRCSTSPAARPRSWRRRPAWSSTTGPVHLHRCRSRCGCRPGRMDMWLDLEPGMWPGVADDLTAYSRQSLDATEDWTISRFANVKRRRRAPSRCRPPRCSRRSTCCSRPTTAVPAFAAAGPPLAVVDGQEVVGADDHAVHHAGQPLLEPGHLGAGRAHRPRACRSACRSSPAATPTRSRCAWPGSWSRPAPGPAWRRPDRGPVLTRILEVAPEGTRGLRRAILRDGRADANVVLEGDDEWDTFHLAAVDDDLTTVGVVTFLERECPVRPGRPPGPSAPGHGRGRRPAGHRRGRGAPAGRPRPLPGRGRGSWSGPTPG